MRWSWFLGRYLDPDAPVDPVMRRRINRVARTRHLSKRDLTLTTVLLLAVLVGGVALLPILLQALGWGGKNLPFMIGLAAIVFVSWPLSALAYGRVYVPACRRASRDLGHELCIACGHSRVGIAEDAACPECGAARMQ